VLEVRDEPYVRFYGNDVVACNDVTGGYGGRATANSAYTAASNQNNYVGGASQLAIFAAGQISGVLPGSQSLRSSLWEYSFANNVLSRSAGLANFGGGFNGGLCGSTIVSTFPNTAGYETGNTNGTNNLNGNKSNPTFSRTGATTIATSNGGSRNIIDNIVIYVDGNLTIQNNIEYSTGGSWNIGSIPSLKVYVTGNIYIDNDVTQLDGQYVAAGDIHTCTNSGVPVLGNVPFIANNCGQNLVINGNFKANKVHFLRSIGTILYGVPYEAYDSSNNPNGSNIAESFRFSPEAYLLEDGGGISPIPGNNPVFDSIIARPPSF